MDKKLIANEIDELQRVVQDLKRNEDLDISLGKLVTAFSKSKEVELSNDIWVEVSPKNRNSTPMVVEAYEKYKMLDALTK